MNQHRSLAAGLLAALVFAPLLRAPLLCAQDFKKQIIYQIVTDRFFDGDTSNDNPSESPGLYDSTKTNWFAYWGGDLAGIQQKIAYIQGLGATAIWISPTVNNENSSMNSSSVSAPYHGYDARDFMQVEEHFGDGANGWTAFNNLVTAAHANNIKVILDWANNHSNYNAAGEQGALYNNGTLMASAGNDPTGIFHHNPDIADYNDRYQLQYYTLSGLTDLNQENATVDNYLKSAAGLFQTMASTHSASTPSSTPLGGGSTPSQTRSTTTNQLFSSVSGSTAPATRSTTTPTSSRTGAASASSTSASTAPCATSLPATTTSPSSTASSPPRIRTSPRPTTSSPSSTATTNRAC